jgi:hypothetical protein
LIIRNGIIVIAHNQTKLRTMAHNTHHNSNNWVKSQAGESALMNRFADIEAAQTLTHLRDGVPTKELLLAQKIPRGWCPIVEVNRLKAELQTTNEGWALDRDELKRALKDNLYLSQKHDDALALMVTSLQNSGAYDDTVDWKNVCNERMVEIRRKEEVIRKKDEKATRLIDIIRGKNAEIKNLRRLLGNKHSQLDFMKGSLGMVSEVVNNKATVVYHPEAAAAERWTSAPKTWDDWITNRFNSTA